MTKFHIKREEFLKFDYNRNLNKIENLTHAFLFRNIFYKI